MFRGLYISGLKHFKDLDMYVKDVNLDLISPPKSFLYTSEGCPAFKQYLEISFDEKGNYFPILYCPLLIKKYPQDSIPHFTHFSKLISWASLVFSNIKCNEYCERTQFLGVDEYREMFNQVNIF